MRVVVVLLCAVAFAAASLMAAGVAPMGTAAHAHDMAARHAAHHGDDAPAGVDCPGPLIACSGIAATPDAARPVTRAACAAERWRETARAFATHEPTPSQPPPKA